MFTGEILSIIMCLYLGSVEQFQSTGVALTQVCNSYTRYKGSVIIKLIGRYLKPTIDSEFLNKITSHYLLTAVKAYDTLQNIRIQSCPSEYLDENIDWWMYPDIAACQEITWDIRKGVIQLGPQFHYKSYVGYRVVELVKLRPSYTINVLKCGKDRLHDINEFFHLRMQPRNIRHEEDRRALSEMVCVEGLTQLQFKEMFWIFLTNKQLNQVLSLNDPEFRIKRSLSVRNFFEIIMDEEKAHTIIVHLLAYLGINLTFPSLCAKCTNILQREICPNQYLENQYW